FFAGGGDVSVANSGDISVHSDYGFANGIGAVAGSAMNPYGSSYIRNTGNIDVFGQYNAAGIQTRASDGDATVINSGDISVESAAVRDVYLPDAVVGIGALNFFGGELTIQNTGDVTVNAYGLAYGLYAKSGNDGNVAITNAGDVAVDSASAANGALGPYGYYAAAPIVARAAFGYSFYGDVTINNTSAGSLDAAGGDAALGVQAVAVSGSIVVNNAGDIHAGGSDFAAGVVLGNYGVAPYGATDWVEGTSTLNNSGSISVDGEIGYAFAVLGADVADTINNSGSISGSIYLYGGDDTINNTGTIDLAAGTSIDLGDGDDTFNTSAVSTLTLQDASILMGAGSANAFNNSGKLVVRGDSLVDMGSGTSGGAPAPVSFGQISAMSAIAPTAVPSLNATPFVNDGVIDFVDGAPDDTLTIVGDFTGAGAIHIDLSMLNGTSDQLYVDGSIVDGTAHRVNVEFTEIPDGTEQPVAFAHVSGDSAAGSFVPGMVTGFSDGNFMSLGVTVL